jgi:medium-chain acyl-[acyl-carrier-protein] hydrolase
MDSTIQILEKHFTIKPNDADFRCRVKISSLINYYIEAAWLHAETLKFGFSDLSPIDLGWVLARLKLNLYKLPSWPGELYLNTWPKGMNRMQYIRDAEMFDGNKETIANITSAWMVVDRETKRPKLYREDDPLLFLHTEKHAIDERIPALKFTGNPTSTTPFTVHYSDLDMNRHLTTIRYIDFMFDTYDQQFIAEHEPREITLNFMREIPLGSHLEMRRFESGKIHGFELINKETQVVCFKGEVSY